MSFDYEESLREKLKKIGRYDDVLITTLEVEEGMPEEPLMPLLALIVEDFKGKEKDLVVEQAAKKFWEDDDFVKSRAFIQILWRNNIENFEAKCKKEKTEKLNK